MTLIVDNRFDGKHGIARYSREIIPRLQIPWTPVPYAGQPGGAVDLFRAAAIRPSAVLYSPGYFVGPTRAIVVPTVHDLIHLSSPEAGGIAKRAYYNHVLRPAVRRSGILLTVSKTSATHIRQWLNDESVRVVDCGNGCSDEFVEVGPSVERQRPYVLYVGNLKSHKNPAVAFESLKLLPDFEIVSVTDNPAAARAMADKYDISNRHTALSAIPDSHLAALYRGAVALVLPSTLEGFGLPAVESLRCGTPVVFYRNCESVAEICIGLTELGVDEHSDAKAFASAIERASDFDMARVDTSMYDWSRVAARVESVLQEVPF